MGSIIEIVKIVPSIDRSMSGTPIRMTVEKERIDFQVFIKMCGGAIVK